mmetsp:Transcript_14929/g.56665  ORF Transcript_14929/g.56665 Transcript_14929/m.56665 type:complete len:269 (-) Transcript_14929:2937-3743(-)
MPTCPLAALLPRRLPLGPDISLGISLASLLLHLLYDLRGVGVHGVIFAIIFLVVHDQAPVFVELHGAAVVVFGRPRVLPSPLAADVGEVVREEIRLPLGDLHLVRLVLGVFVVFTEVPLQIVRVVIVVVAAVIVLHPVTAPFTALLLPCRLFPRHLLHVRHERLVAFRHHAGDALEAVLPAQLAQDALHNRAQVASAVLLGRPRHQCGHRHRQEALHVIRWAGADADAHQGEDCLCNFAGTSFQQGQGDLQQAWNDGADVPSFLGGAG